MKKLIVFDCFGTLITPANDAGPNPYVRLGYSKVQRRQFLTRNLSIEDFAKQLGKEELIPLLHSELEVQLNGVMLYPDVPEWLASLRESGWKIGLCSNLAMDFGARVKELLQDMDAYIFSYEIGAMKPEREIYTAVCKTMSCPPEDVLFIGNSKKADLDGPAEFGMRSALIDRSRGESFSLKWLSEST